MLMPKLTITCILMMTIYIIIHDGLQHSY